MTTTLRLLCIPPRVPDEARTVVQTVIASARNEWIRSTANIVCDGLDAMVAAPDEEDQEAPEPDEGGGTMTASISPWAALLPPVAHTPDGLETLTDVLVALSDGAPVPQRAAEHLAQALRPCLTGDNDIAGRLGLRAPRRGGAHEAPVALAKNLQRDSLVRSVVANMGPPKATSALALQVLWSYFFARPQDPSAHAGRSKNLPLVCELAKSHGPPLSHRQILRIANGETAYTRRCKK